MKNWKDLDWHDKVLVKLLIALVVATIILMLVSGMLL